MRTRADSPAAARWCFLKRDRQRVVTLLLFVVYVGFVMVTGFGSMRLIERSALTRFRLESEQQAAVLGHYFQERQGDVLQLAESDAVLNYFRNSDLGMTKEYGLGANATLIEERLEREMSRKRVGSRSAYSALALIDDIGQAIVGINGKGISEGDARTWLLPEHRGVRVRLVDAAPEVLVSAPVWINGGFRGEVLAWVPVQESLAQFGSAPRAPDDASPVVTSLIVERATGRVLGASNPDFALTSSVESGIKTVVAIPPGEAVQLSVGGEARFGVRVDIGQTPLSFVSIASESVVETGLLRLFLVASGVIPAIVLVLVFLDFRDARRLETERESARLEAERLARARSDFLANMSHEIRTPMNAIIGMTELSLNTSLSTKQRNYLSKIQSASETLLRIVNDVLDFSKIEAGKLEIEHIAFDLNQVLNEVGALVGDKAWSKSIELAFIPDPAMPVALVGDPFRLGQILINLIGNAIKFSASGSVIVRMHCEHEPTGGVRLHCAVVDEGIGLSRPQIERLFSAFSQADSTTTRRYGGTGLGLVICKHLVEMMGGQITVESTSGKGSTFRFSVALGLVDSGGGMVAAWRRRLAPFADRPVLLFGEHPVWVEAMRAQLAQLGLTSEAVESITQAATRIGRQDAPDCLAVFVDCANEHAGLSFLKALEKQLAHKRMPPPILTLAGFGAETSPLPESGVFSGTTESVVHKPTTSGRLFSSLAAVLNLGDVVSVSDALAKTERLSLAGIEVLVVDDSPINQEVVQEMLMEAGVRVRLAENGHDAIDRLTHDTLPDCVLMDCQMPVMDGYEATRAIRRDARLRRLPIIALTANAMSHDRARCIQSGMDDYLAKPVRCDDLLATIARHLVRRGMAALVPDPAGSDVSEHRTEVFDFPGLDYEIGLRYANGKHSLYCKLLRVFVDSHGKHFAQDFTALFEHAEWEAARRMAHTLKSSARLIGGTRLGDLAWELEKACDARLTEASTAAFAAVLAELKRVIEGLARLPEQ